jgi:hypothetical protein
MGEHRVLEKKASGYHDLQLTEQQQTLKAADAGRARAQDEAAGRAVTLEIERDG